MFIIYQLRSRLLHTQQCTNLVCPTCNTKGNIEIGIYQRYVWLLWPMRPAGKYGIAICSYCNGALPTVQWTDAIEGAYLQLKKEAKTPRGLWRGMLLMPASFGILILLAVEGTSIFARWNKKKAITNKAALDSRIIAPLPGDLYRVMDMTNTTNTAFTYLRLASLSDDTLFIQKLRHSTPKWDDWESLQTVGHQAEYDTTLLPMDYNFFKKT